MKLSQPAIAVLAGAAIVAGVPLLRHAESGAPAQALAATAVPPTSTSGGADAGALERYLRFEGDGSVTVKPDTAEVDVTTTGTAATSQDALAASSAAMEKVMARLAALGIARSDMQSSGVYTYHDETSGDYQASNSLAVTLHDPSQAGKVLAEASDAGADDVSGPSFSVADQDAAYRDALRKAMQDARAKADAAAAAMGVHVTGVVSVTDQTQPDQPVPFMAAAAGRAASTPNVPIATGTLDVSASVVVVFGYGS
jgi:uncharacterized protein YggE